MAHYSVEFCRSELDKYVAAEAKALAAQNYSIGARSLARANLETIRDGIKYWSDQLTTAETSPTGVHGVSMRRTISHD